MGANSRRRWKAYLVAPDNMTDHGQPYAAGGIGVTAVRKCECKLQCDWPSFVRVRGECLVLSDQSTIPVAVHRVFFWRIHHPPPLPSSIRYAKQCVSPVHHRPWAEGFHSVLRAIFGLIRSAGRMVVQLIQV